ncbi:MAG: hypothetical protein HDR28_00455 [Lachnospiraceae bacterium]|nr:hypothetical protein [Lachnospiraceae bacterium]
MHYLEKQLLDYGIIDAPIESIKIDEWFENLTLTYKGNQMQTVFCKFINCFEISLNHDKAYSKNRSINGKLDYKYFVQNIEIAEEDNFFAIAISAWPLDAKIVCKEFSITTS